MHVCIYIYTQRKHCYIYIYIYISINRVLVEGCQFTGGGAHSPPHRPQNTDHRSQPVPHRSQITAMLTDHRSQPHRSQITAPRTTECSGHSPAGTAFSTEMPCPRCVSTTMMCYSFNAMLQTSLPLPPCHSLLPSCRMAR